MLRTRILAVATATLLMLGMSVGGAGAAFADEDLVETVETVETVEVVEPAETEVEQPTERLVVVGPTSLAPANHNDDHVEGGAHPDGGANQIPICHATPPDTAAQGWNLLGPDDDAVATNQAGHASEHDMDIIPSFEYWQNNGSGNGPNSDWVLLTYPGKNLTTNFGGVTGAQILANDCVKPTVTPPVNYEVGLYLYKKLDPNAPASWPNSGPQTLIDDKEGTEWFTEFPGDLPQDVCGPGWAVQQDKVSFTGTFTWPESITYPVDNIGWPPIYDAQHDDLDNYIDVPDCEEATAAVTVVERDCFVGTSFDIDEVGSENVTWGDPVIDDVEGTISITATANDGLLFEESLEGVSDDRTQRTFTAPYEPAGGDDCVLPAIGVVADSSAITCDLDGWFSFGPAVGVSDEDAALLVWTVGPVAYAGDDEPGVQHPVTEDVTITVTVSLVESAQGDYALNDETGDGEVNEETGAITWTFLFTAEEDCLEGAVVPLVTYVDDCEEMSYTIYKADGVTYTRTINGFEFEVTFDGDDESVTYTAALLDDVTVTATADDGFVLPDDYEPWNYQFVEGFCPDTGPATTASVEFTLGECEGDSSVELTDEGGVVWRINGEIVDGNTTHALAAGSDVEVTATLEEASDEYPLGWTWSDPEQVTSWEESVAASDPNCSPELAYTGIGSFSDQLGAIALLLTLAGVGLVVRRHRLIEA